MITLNGTIHEIPANKTIFYKTSYLLPCSLWKYCRTKWILFESQADKRLDFGQRIGKLKTFSHRMLIFLGLGR